MAAFFLRRLFLLLPTILGIVTIAFFANRSSGISPAVLMYPKASPEIIQKLEHENGWDKPIHQQFVSYLKQLARGDLGKNYIVSGHTVLHELKTRFPATMELSLCALFVAIMLGIPIGILAAVKANTWLDYASMTVVLTGISFPIFCLAMLLIMLLGDSLPFNGRLNSTLEEQFNFSRHSNFLLWDTFFYGNSTLFLNACKHLILPTITLATIPMAVIARITRSSMLEVIAEDYIRTARAKGLGPFRVYCKHALKNAIPQINTAIGLQTGALLAGAVLTENIFRWNGLGTYVFDCALNREPYGTPGTVILLAMIFVAANLLVDFSYALVDPRVHVN